jgi:hypothetical protein
MGSTISRARFHGDKQGFKLESPAAGSSVCMIQPDQQGRGAPENAAIVMNHTLQQRERGELHTPLMGQFTQVYTVASSAHNVGNFRGFSEEKRTACSTCKCPCSCFGALYREAMR